MFRSVALFTLVSCAFAGTLPDDLSGRIVNGDNTSIQQHPYQVSVQRNGKHHCGGTIVDAETIVTAAHCVKGTSASALSIRLGSTSAMTDGVLVQVRAIAYHPGYNSKTKANDVAIIKLATRVQESSTIRYIALASSDPADGTTAVVTGWGSKCFKVCSSERNTLQEIYVKIVQWKACASSEYKYGSSIDDTMICAYETKKDACQGDSGGPLVADGVLVGVVSWGYLCARNGYPGVYADIAANRAWLDAEIKNL